MVDGRCYGVNGVDGVDGVNGVSDGRRARPTYSSPAKSLSWVHEISSRTSPGEPRLVYLSSSRGNQPETCKDVGKGVVCVSA